MASKDQNKSQKSNNNSTAAGQGKQSTPLTQKNNKPSEIRISIQEYSPEVAAANSSATSGSRGHKKRKDGTDASKESKPSSSSDAWPLPTSSVIQQQGTSASSGNAAQHNTQMDDTVDVDVDYNEDEDEVDDDERPFGRQEFSELAFDRMRSQVGSPLSDATENYGCENDPLPVKQAEKAELMKDARHERRKLQKQRLKDLVDRGLVDNEAHKLLSWEQLADVYVSERDAYKRSEQVAADAREELRKALDDRTTALKQAREHKVQIQVEQDKLKRLKEQHAKELAAAVDTASKARENVFALQNKKLHAAEAAKEELLKKHLEDIAALEAKHADSSTQQAYDEATIRTLRAERDQIALDYNDLILLKDRLRGELLDLRNGGTGTLTAQVMATDPHQQPKLFQAGGSSVGSSTSQGQGSQTPAPRARHPRPSQAASSTSAGQAGGGTMSGVFSPFPPSGSSTLGQFWNQSSPSAVLAQD